MSVSMKLGGACVFASFFGALVAGCGGSSSGGSSQAVQPIGQTVATPFYATDKPTPNYRNVWVTIDSVNLVNSAGQPVAAFTSNPGVSVDVRSLRDATGQLFEFLDSAGLPAGSYTGAQIVVDNSVTVVPAGSTTSTTYQFANSNSGGQGETLFKVTFNKPFTANGSNPLVFDFDLSNWSVNAQNQISASVNLVYGANVSATGRQVSRPMQGVVSNLAGKAGAQTFDLVHDRNEVLQVQTSSTTTITNSDGAPNPSLADAERLYLTGTITDGMFVASEITIENSAAVPPLLVHIQGPFSGVNATAGAFTLSEQSCDKALSSTQITVDTSSSTVFTSDGIGETQADFFSQLAQYPNATVSVVGSLSGTTLTATNANVNVPKGGTGQTHLIAAIGTSSSPSASAGTFTLTLTGWEGTDLSKGSTLSVVTNSATTYNLNGQSVSESTWFAALTSTTPVFAIGTDSNGTLTAVALVIGNQTTGLGQAPSGQQGGNGNH